MFNVDRINREVYDSAQTVQVYGKTFELQKVEQTIIEMLKNQLSEMRMLDIGIGGGRTTMHLAFRVKEYLGIDYAQNMIAVCQKRFSQDMSNKLFRQMDVRAMNDLAEHSFDFVFFSYNGIDYMPHEDRLKALNQIKRVIKPMGYFCFSSHNFNYLEHYIHVPICRNPIRWWQMMNRSWEVRNRMKVKKQISYAIISDGGEEFRVRTYYSKPLQQIQHLANSGFINIRVFSEQTGQEIQDRMKLEEIKNDRWLYYLCQAGQ